MKQTTQKRDGISASQKKKHTLLHTIGFSHPAVETNIKTDEEAPTVQEDTYQMHR